MGAGSVKGDWRMVVGEAGRAEGRIPHVKGRHKQTTTKPTHTHERQQVGAGAKVRDAEVLEAAGWNWSRGDRDV